MPRMPGTLFIVATPIGNLEDTTQRARRVLTEVDLIACEDTRRTRTLLNHFGIHTKTISYHEHNEDERAARLCELLESGHDIALVSDAGTPLISDPGFRVVQVAIQNGINVVPVPGPAAFVAALVASGLPSDQFLFAGFLPARASARRARLEELRPIPATLVFYEAPHRIAASLNDLLEVLGDRPAAIAREITKLHEEMVRGKLSELAGTFSETGSARGEFVLVINGPSSSPADEPAENAPARLAGRVSELERDGLNAKEALKQAARELGLKRAEAYRMMVAQKSRRSR